jgi:hypothetical protein
MGFKSCHTFTLTWNLPSRDALYTEESCLANLGIATATNTISKQAISYSFSLRSVIYSNKQDNFLFFAHLHDKSFCQKFAQRKLCQNYPIYMIKVFIPISAINSKTHKMAELDLDSEKMF